MAGLQSLTNYAILYSNAECTLNVYDAYDRSFLMQLKKKIAKSEMIRRNEKTSAID